MTSSRNNSAKPLLKLIHILGYAGLIPFIISIGLILDGLWFGFGPRNATLLTHFASYIFITYSAVILSFMSGTLWANWHKIKEQNLAKCALLMSNFLALSAWLSVLMSYIAPFMAAYSVTFLMFGFISLLWVEHLIGGLEKAYWRMRLLLTGIVTVLHLVMTILIFMEF